MWPGGFARLTGHTLHVPSWVLALNVPCSLIPSWHLLPRGPGHKRSSVATACEKRSRAFFFFHEFYNFFQLKYKVHINKHMS